MGDERNHHNIFLHKLTPDRVSHSITIVSDVDGVIYSERLGLAGICRVPNRLDSRIDCESGLNVIGGILIESSTPDIRMS